jgi:hypothetical protein
MFPRLYYSTVSCTYAAAGHFQHIFIDEAAQALEPEVFIPLALAGKIALNRFRAHPCISPLSSVLWYVFLFGFFSWLPFFFRVPLFSLPLHRPSCFFVRFIHLVFILPVNSLCPPLSFLSSLDMFIYTELVLTALICLTPDLFFNVLIY